MVPLAWRHSATSAPCPWANTSLTSAPLTSGGAQPRACFAAQLQTGTSPALWRPYDTRAVSVS